MRARPASARKSESAERPRPASGDRAVRPVETRAQRGCATAGAMPAPRRDRGAFSQGHLPTHVSRRLALARAGRLHRQSLLQQLPPAEPEHLAAYDGLSPPMHVGPAWAASPTSRARRPAARCARQRCVGAQETVAERTALPAPARQARRARGTRHRRKQPGHVNRGRARRREASNCAHASASAHSSSSELTRTHARVSERSRHLEEQQQCVQQPERQRCARLWGSQVAGRKQGTCMCLQAQTVRSTSCVCDRPNASTGQAREPPRVSWRRFVEHTAPGASVAAALCRCHAFGTVLQGQVRGRQAAAVNFDHFQQQQLKASSRLRWRGTDQAWRGHLCAKCFGLLKCWHAAARP